MAQVVQRSHPTPREFRDRLATTVLAFRGYNVTNLGRTAELLEHDRYGPILHWNLHRGSVLCQDVLGYPVDLVRRVREQRETSLASYGEAIALVVAVELAQLEILKSVLDIDWRRCNFSFGYSLGEVAAIIAGGAISFEDALTIPLRLARDCVELAEGTTLAVLFSRRLEINAADVDRLCQGINQVGQGVLGVSAILSPNSVLLIGQGDTLDRFADRMSTLSTDRLFLRRNEHKWPPLHTPIVWQRNVVCRARRMMHIIPAAGRPPQPPVFSLVTGDLAYQQADLRQLFGDWIDRPQRLWNAVEFSLRKGMTDVIHVGPQPNITPATFDRLSQNVEAQLRLNRGYKALSRMMRRPWLQALLPKRASLLRAPQIRQVVLEDWLLEFDSQEGVPAHMDAASHDGDEQVRRVGDPS